MLKNNKFALLILALVMVFAVACGGGETVADVAEDAAEAVSDVAEEAVEAAEDVVEDAAEVVEDAMSGVMLPEVDPLDLEGNVISAGSSTVFPLAERMAEVFQEDGFEGEISISSIGSGGGFERFCVAGETDIATASRPIKDKEIEDCAAIGRTPIEFRVGTDALAVTVSKDNDFVDNLTVEELALLYSTAETWADVNPEWPAEPIQRFTPGTDSGTFDYFVEAVFHEDQAPILEADNVQLSEDDNVLVEGIKGSPYAVGYFGYAYFLENQDSLRVINIEGITPTAESAEDGSYALSRPLYLYTDAGIMTDKPQVAGFMNFFLTNVNNEIIDVGYFPAAAETLDAAKQTLLDAIGG